jgi:hypothetical protein
MDRGAGSKRHKEGIDIIMQKQQLVIQETLNTFTMRENKTIYNVTN